MVGGAAISNKVPTRFPETTKMKIVIIGGGSAGTTCAFEIRKRNKDVEITILEKTAHTEYSPCALPYVLSGEIENRDDIFLFDEKEYTANDIILSLNSEVIQIDKEQKHITYRKGEETKELEYDKLILATGSTAFVPFIPRADDVTYATLQTIDDAQEIAQTIREGTTSIVIGAGLIGVELALSLSQQKENVTLIEAQETIFPSIVDADIAKKIKANLEEKNITIYQDTTVQRISSDQVFLENEAISYDALFFCTGVRPNTSLAQNAGLRIDTAICVDEYMQTSDQDILACGDCVESVEFNTSEKILSQLGTTAVRQAQTIAENIFSDTKVAFPAVVNNTVTKLGDMFVASVGLTKRRAQKVGIETVTARYTGGVRSEYYPSESMITIKLVSSTQGIILGAQIIGHEEVVGRIDTVSLAIQKRCHVRELASLETCYNPASAPIFDPLTVVSSLSLKKLHILNGVKNGS